MMERHALPVLVFPAPAGMNRNNAEYQSLLNGVPRACGDEPHLRGR